MIATARRWWLAALLSLLAPGLGQIYATRVRRGVAFLATDLGVLAFGIAGAALSAPNSLQPLGLVVLLLLFQLALRVGAAVDAGVIAYRSAAPTGRTYRWYVYGAILIAAWLASAAVISAGRAAAIWSTYRISSASTAPLLLEDELVFAWKGHYRDHEPQRGDLAVFKLPRDMTTDYIKRVIGLPGDRIRISAGRLYINGALVAREPIELFYAPPDATPYYQYIETLENGVRYRIMEQGDDGPLDNTPEYVVPADSYFVLGDNRDNSLDSRVQSAVGYIPRRNFTDRPGIVLFARDRDRIGLLLQPAD